MLPEVSYTIASATPSSAARRERALLLIANKPATIAKLPVFLINTTRLLATALDVASLPAHCDTVNLSLIPHLLASTKPGRVYNSSMPHL
jgi:hypothetical protein